MSDITQHAQMIARLKNGVVALGQHREIVQGLVGQHIESHDASTIPTDTDEGN